MTIYLLQFNPYSNRQIKGYASISAYSDYIIESFANINFNPNDGVETNLIINSSGAEADYLICCDDASGMIISRWFILDASRTRVGQYDYKIRRDVVFDHLSEIKNSVAYINKGWCNRNDSSIYNSESLQVNQIKKSEILLKDVTKTPWIVGYLGKTDEATTVSRKNIFPEAVAISEAVFNKLNDHTVLKDKIASGISFRVPSSGRSLDGRFYVANFNENGRLPLTRINITTASWSTQGDAEGRVSENDMLALSDELSEVEGLFSTIQSEISSGWTDVYSDYKQYKNQIVSYSGRYYRCSFVASAMSENKTLQGDSLSRSIIFNALRSNSRVAYKPQVIADAPASVDFTTIIFTPKLEEIVDEYSATIPATENRVNLNNQPYSMFAMPYLDFEAGGADIVLQELQGQASISIAQAISDTFSGSGELYDLQLVPYCPILGYVDTVEGTSFIWLDDMPVGSYTPITYTSGGTTETVGYIFWCAEDSFSIDIPVEYSFPEYPMDFKIENQSVNWRLCSPNYSGAFEFSPAKNNGITQINVDCTYKPYSPYIHLNPDFGGLYGRDYNDARGLICGGDFSLPQINDAWQTYQIQNKNYANSFERDVQSIELRNRYAIAGDIVNATIGSGSGAVSGFMMGGGIGAVAGAGLSAAGGAADVILNQRLRDEALDLKKDQFNFSLQNIQALPTTLSKVGSLNANNKLWPFIEIYDCLDGEKDAIRNKLLYNGFTIDKIAEIFKYCMDDTEKEFYEITGFFLQCKLIRTEIHDDWHMIRTIKDELEMGVYL